MDLQKYQEWLGSYEAREGEKLVGFIQGKHGIITIVTPDREPHPGDLKDLYKVVVEISINIAKGEAQQKKLAGG